MLLLNRMVGSPPAQVKGLEMASPFIASRKVPPFLGAAVAAGAAAGACTGAAAAFGAAVGCAVGWDGLHAAIVASANSPHPMIMPTLFLNTFSPLSSLLVR